MRKIEFRFFDTTSKKMYCMPSIGDYSLEQVFRFAKTDDQYTKVMQYTGLKDCNGVKIFEGDKLKCLGYEGVVVYDSEEPRFAIKPDDCSDTFALIKYEMQNFEIIGNIHEAQS